MGTTAFQCDSMSSEPPPPNNHSIVSPIFVSRAMFVCACVRVSVSDYVNVPTATRSGSQVTDYGSNQHWSYTEPREREREKERACVCVCVYVCSAPSHIHRDTFTDTNQLSPQVSPRVLYARTPCLPHTHTHTHTHTQHISMIGSKPIRPIACAPIYRQHSTQLTIHMVDATSVSLEKMAPLSTWMPLHMTHGLTAFAYTIQYHSHTICFYHVRESVPEEAEWSFIHFLDRQLRNLLPHPFITIIIIIILGGFVKYRWECCFPTLPFLWLSSEPIK